MFIPPLMKIHHSFYFWSFCSK